MPPGESPGAAPGIVRGDSGYFGEADSTGISLVDKGSVSPGETTCYQFWYRDNNGPCGSGSNPSNGIEVIWR